MIKGANQRVATEGGDFTPFAGLDIAKVLCVNPSNEQYEAITGRKPNYDLTYDAYKNEDGSLSQPYRFLTYNEQIGYHFADFNVSNAEEVSKAGNKRFIDIKGSASWGASLEALAANPKMSWFDSSKARLAKRGEVSILNFLTTFLRYDSRSEGAQIMKDLKETYKIDSYEKGAAVPGINKLLKDFQDQSITLFYVVKKSDDKLYQEISTRNDTFFLTNPDGSFSSKCIYRLKKIKEECETNGMSFVKEGRLFLLEDAVKMGAEQQAKVDKLPFDDDAQDTSSDW